MPVNQQLLSDIKEYAEQYFFENSVSPSIREIAAHFNVGKSTVQRYLERLRDCGEIEYDGRRSIKTSETEKYETSCVNVGVVGDIVRPAYIRSAEYYRIFQPACFTCW